MHKPRYEAHRTNDAAIVDGGFPLDRNIRLIYGFAIARACLFVVPILVPYFTLEVGLSFHQFILSEAAFALAVVLFEVPSGWLADHWQRKGSMSLGSGFWVAGILAMWTADGFTQLLIAQAQMGLGHSLQSGADSALLYDSLVRRNRQDQFLKYEARRHGLGLATIAIASSLAGLIYGISPHLVFALDALALLVTGICAAFLVEPSRAKPDGHVLNLAAMFRVIIDECHRNRTIFWLLLYAAGLLSATKAAVWLQQAYLVSLDLDLFWFGPVSAAGFFCGALASQLGPVADRLLGAKRTLALTVLLLSAGFALAGWWHSLFALPLLFLGAATWGLCGPVLNMLVQRQVSSDRRATILSVLSLSYQLAFIPLAHGIGRVADDAGADIAYVSLAAFVILAAGGAWLGLSRSFRRNNHGGEVNKL